MSENMENTNIAEETVNTQNCENEIVSEIYDEMGVIGPDTKVYGNISTKGHVTILGTVKGDISANGNVIVKGIVKGKITCDNILLENANVQANIEAKHQVSIKDGVTVNGQILCGSINVRGTVLGDINARDKVGLAETAIINGDITAAYLGAALGAKINGRVSIG